MEQKVIIQRILLTNCWSNIITLASLYKTELLGDNQDNIINNWKNQISRDVARQDKNKLFIKLNSRFIELDKSEKRKQNN